MAVHKRKKRPQNSLKVKLATYLLGIILVLPTLNSTAKAFAETKLVSEQSRVVVAASYRNELQDTEAKVQQNVISYTPIEPVINAPTRIREPEPVAMTGNDAAWDKLASCESGGNWSTNTGNGYFGGIQFSQGSWNAVGGSGLPSQTSREEQIRRGKILLARGGWSSWPACARSLGLV